MNVLVIDLETTGEKPPAEVVEVASWLVADGTIGPIHDHLCKIAGTIPPEISAIHHITAKDLENVTKTFHDWMQPYCDDPGIHAYCAHNAKFEQQWVTELYTGTRPWICTYKCAMRAWPDAPKFNNQALRYFLANHNLRRDYCNNAHRAAPDAYVTALTLQKLLEQYPVSTLIQWTIEPTRYPRVPFGKHARERWSEVPQSYLTWMIRQAGSDMDPDAIACARLALNGQLT